MKLLILGGTAWLGHETAAAAAADGHIVTCAARGSSGEPPAGTTFLQLDRDADDGLAAAAQQHWDAVIDVSRQPGQVRRAVRDLRDAAGFYVFVSTGNVYASQREFGQDEDAALLAPLAEDIMRDMDSYGPAKVACEQAVMAGFGADACAVVRAGLIGGPGDTSGRSGYWPLRFARGGRVLVPDAPDQPTQLIDVRDLAQWLIQIARERTGGVFNAVGDTVPFAEHLAAAATAAAAAGEPDGREAGAQTAEAESAFPQGTVPAPAGWLREQGVSEWSGPRSLPLWLEDPDWHGMNARSNARARAAGLRLRPLQQTLGDTLAWEEAVGVERPRGAGLTGDEERGLLARLAGSKAPLSEGSVSEGS
ncbi:NAD-dependent epimerase/dehydratase family protein [Arthrobacter sp. zg-Y769]|uniref:NAD-dependent epimerase/dehydratase family protein n=1 Tax=Arthrobacter sp. zg-Y769 TaxID=2894191 RepID=UPI001E41C1AC|nr:NAD-dependent epimerase/dehydratase family protein [Arthrobacter sp. zg-Y769]MCC9205153.1 NAD-dependent epimerase/dehydratase family protein [Arthrobacter sp. zg-Y769]